MKTTYMAAVALVVAIAGALLAYPAIANAATTTSPATQSATGSTGIMPNQGPPHWGMNGGPNFGAQFAPGQRGGGPQGRGGSHGAQNQVTLSNGQAITLTSTKGEYRVVGDSAKNGTASGTLTFTVSGKLSGGYILTIGGSIIVNGTTYTISSGSAQMSPVANGISGQGTTSAGGSFLVNAVAHGDFTGTSTANVSLDFSNGITEYAVNLVSTISG